MIILSEVNQKEEDKYHMISSYVESKIYHKQTHRHRELTCGCQSGVGKHCSGSLVLADAN